uniref:C-type lectin domain-containing protein n=1 Tax=Scleropages formosus TaxID=113540 RepID=A0A8C9RUP9_SCLFO
RMSFKRDPVVSLNKVLNMNSPKNIELNRKVKTKFLSCHLCSAERLKACSQGWKCFKSKQYYISTERKSWTESQKDCKERGADLVIINSKEEQFTGPFWIGLSDREREGTWKWVDGTTLYWKESQPDNFQKNENCVETRKTNSQKTWNDFQCDEKLSWICEKEG